MIDIPVKNGSHNIIFICFSLQGRVLSKKGLLSVSACSMYFIIAIFNIMIVILIANLVEK